MPTVASHRVTNATGFSTGSTSSGLSSGGITGIIFAIIFILFFIIPFGYAFGKEYWKNRHRYDWYNTLTNPNEWCSCDCCSQPSARQTFQLPSNTSGNTNVHETENEETVNTADTVVFRPPTVSYLLHICAPSTYLVSDTISRFAHIIIRP